MAERAAGQAQVEMIAVLPLLAGLAVVALQLMAFGYAQSLADGSAEAGAVAIAAGRPAAAAARAGQVLVSSQLGSLLQLAQVEPYERLLPMRVGLPDGRPASAYSVEPRRAAPPADRRPA